MFKMLLGRVYIGLNLCHLLLQRALTLLEGLVLSQPDENVDQLLR